MTSNLIKINENAIKKILFSKHQYNNELQKSLNIVRDFIINKKLILVGGMAIDMALRLKGDKIYDDEEEIPDYDVYSPEFHKDAYDLAELLYTELQINDINVINARHISTLKVRVHFTTVSDITFIPKNIYDKLPTLNYETNFGTFKIIHPHYQMINQHRSLYIPYENAPYETIFFRWKKDMLRFELLNKYYGLKNNDEKLIKIKTIPIKLDKKKIEGCCIGGYSALLFWLYLATNLGYKTNLFIGSIELTKDNIEFKLFDKYQLITIFNSDIFGIRTRFAPLNKFEQFYPFLDIMPEKIIINDNYELLNNKGYLISSYLYEDINIVNIQHCLLYFMFQYIIKNQDDELMNFYKYSYIIALDILYWSINKYMNTKNIDDKKKYRPFLPSVETFGNINENISLSYQIFKMESILGFKNKDQIKLPSKFYITDTIKEVPEEYYNYDPYKELILKMDGSKMELVESVL